jgi:pyruvate,water dikinase
MPAGWKRLASLLAAGRTPKPRRVSIAERFRAFRVIGAANNDFLSTLASLQDRLGRGGAAGAASLASGYEALSTPVGVMARALAELSGGRYQDLVRRYEALDRELVLEVLKERPMEVGPLVVWSDSPEARNPASVGPKAARLSEITASGAATVPPFFCITVHAYRLFMEATGIQDLVREALGAGDLADSHSLRSFSSVVAAAIEAASVPNTLADEIMTAHARLRGACASEFGVAVRSSAVVEDSESSFAGQFESLLGVGEGGLLDAYKSVVASKYRAEALRYALARGFMDEDVLMPVLVMAMVQPKAAGVAYSRSPDGPAHAMVTAVRGLAQPIVEGRVIPDVFMVAPGPQPRIEAASRGSRSLELRCSRSGGLVESAPADVPGDHVLDDAGATRVARAAWSMERHFGCPQDIEWVVDEKGALFVVQTRPLQMSPFPDSGAAEAPLVEGYRVLVKGAVSASGGAASGKVFVLADPALADTVPEGAVLVTPTTSPRLAGLLPTVAAVVAAAGSATGHMATVAREFGVPCLVGATAALENLRDGATVTVDAWTGTVYEGEVQGLALSASGPEAMRRRNAVQEGLQRLLERTAPLTLTEPDSPAFTAENCRTLHDIARFVHQRAMAEMFDLEGLSAVERRASKRLDWRMPMPVLMLDLGGGLAPVAGSSLRQEYVNSAPLLALIEGMTDPRLRWSGPVGFDPKGFMSVVVRSAVDDQRYGEPSYALCARDYVHFASRLAYHFATVDAVCGSIVNENYARFLFHGGAAVAQRREWRARFLALVLEHNLFAVKQAGDRVEAIQAKRPAEQIEEALVMLGRLMVASRHLDMLMESHAAAESLAQAFLSGDFGFERVRRRMG